MAISGRSTVEASSIGKELLMVLSRVSDSDDVAGAIIVSTGSEVVSATVTPDETKYSIRYKYNIKQIIFWP